MKKKFPRRWRSPEGLWEKVYTVPELFVWRNNYYVERYGGRSVIARNRKRRS